jgi:polyisoprenoid-binding protein YceI
MSTPIATQTRTTTWNLDPAHSTAEFKVKHMMITNVKGQFSDISGTITIDESDITKSRVEASVDAVSINTRNPDRDAHLRSADFFDVDRFPKLTFTSTGVRRTGGDELEVEGEFTIHGVTRKVTFIIEGPSAPAKDPWGNTRLGLTATTKIKRKEFGLTWNSALETGGVLVGEEVTITIDVQAIKA